MNPLVPKFVFYRHDTGHLACDVRICFEGAREAAAIKPEHLLRDTEIKNMAPEHRRLVMQLVMHGTSVARGCLLRGDNGFAVAKAMVDAGCGHWLRGDGYPLRWDAARTVTLAWNVGKYGTYQPVFAPTRAGDFILPLSPPLYVDVRKGVCGPLTGCIDANATGEWAEPRPPMELPGALAFCNALARRFPRETFPLPAAPDATEQRDTPPVPCLLVTGRVPPPNTPEAGPAVPIVRLTFDYGVAQVTYAAPEETMVAAADGLVVRCARDRTAEARTVERLRELGFAPLEECFPLPLAQPLRDWCLLPAATSDWATLESAVFPELTGTGWRVEHDAQVGLSTIADSAWYADLEAGETNGWFDFRVGLRIGRKRINLLPAVHQFLATNRSRSIEEMGRLLNDRQVPVPLEGQGFALISGSRFFLIIRHLLELYEDAPEAGPRTRVRLDLWRAAEIAQLEQLAASPWQRPAALQSLSKRLERLTRLVALPGPAALQAELRPYQQWGLAWLQFLRESEFDGILADDMGLGKTVQTLAHILVEKEAGRLDKPCLIVTPTSVISNWSNEARRFAPSLSLLVLQGSGRKDDFAEIGKSDLVLTSYALLRRDAEFLQRQPFSLVVLDEGHYVKNHRAQTAQSARGLNARRRLCLTGTPIENHLGELWSLFDFLMPGFLGSAEDFQARYRTPIEKDGSESVRQFLSRRLAPFMLRRRKSEVERELPPKTITLHRIELGERQRELYESVRLAMEARIRDEVETRGLARSQITILTALLKLRQICCDPRLSRARQIPEPTAEDSAKLQALMDMLTEMKEEGRRVLVFSQFVGMLDLIETELRALAINYAVLTGQTTDRVTPVRRFQEGEADVFLISLKAGGVGLNLTAADTVIHYDPWWNPAAENQATDRAHRIGQDKPVFVYRFVSVGTVEERIQAMQERKQKLADSILREQRADKIGFTAKDLEALLAPIGGDPQSGVSVQHANDLTLG